ncbi:phosphate signaling complex protein PhoU [Candidatus Bipolaricaulota bacterium]|nr:phosphate signaling complex protein PhoU [Candidatus Bipolaricaulota bacterium]
MPRKRYAEQLEDLRRNVLKMGDLVLGRLKDAMTAMIEADVDRADEIGAGDDRIDDMYVSIEGDCANLLALQQPVAVDLRLITASYKIITDLERIGDKVVNLTDYTQEFDAEFLLDKNEIVEMSDFAGGMIDDALTYYDLQDLENARSLIKRDEEMDRMCEENTNKILHHLIKKESTSLSTEEATTLGGQVLLELLTIRDLERVADHATNIAARTIYLITSERDMI